MRLPARLARAFMTTTRSAMVVASIWSWVTRIVVTPSSRWMRRISVRMVQSQPGVEVRQRLVEQQQVRPLDQRPGERHALLLSAGSWLGRRSSSAVDAHKRRNLARAAFRLSCVRSS